MAVFITAIPNAKIVQAKRKLVINKQILDIVKRLILKHNSPIAKVKNDALK